MKLKRFNENNQGKEIVRIRDITDYGYPDDILGWKLIEQENVYFDGEKGYVDYECVLQREKDDKFFKFTYSDWGRGEGNFLEQTAVEVEKKEPNNLF